MPPQSVAWAENALAWYMPRGSAEGCSPRGQPTEDGADEIRELAEARAVPTNPVACGARSEALRMTLDDDGDDDEEDDGDDDDDDEDGDDDEKEKEAGGPSSPPSSSSSSSSRKTLRLSLE